MLLSTIVPFEQIFGAVSSGGPPPQTQRVPGGIVELDGQGRVGRLYSTDPGLFLNPRFAPGAPFAKAPGVCAPPRAEKPSPPQARG